jgi:DNA-binding winged helix-turn-helix (wHTH) protein/Tol biopolymer transport system component
MNYSPPKARFAKFGLFEADLAKGVLTKNGFRVKLQDQPFEVLVVLLERPGELITREEIRRRLWSADTFVAFNDGLNTAIKKLRNALSDEAENPRFIETVPRKGYRFIAPVSDVSPPRVSVAITTHLANPIEVAPQAIRATDVVNKETSRFAGRHPVIAAVLVAALICAVVVGSVAPKWSKHSVVPHLVRITQLTHSGVVHANQNLATDGVRLYYIEREKGDWALKSMPSTGGTSTKLEIPLPRYDLQDLSPDASEMLLRKISTDADSDTIWIMSSVGGPIHRVGDVHVSAAAYTADGRSVTFGDGDTVYLCDKEGRNIRKMFSAGGDVLRLRWSPQGNILRFIVNDPSRHTSSLWQINVDGSGMRPLLPDWNVPKWEWTMGWSHDACWFAFSAAHDGGTDIWLLEHDPSSSGSDQKPVQLTAGPIEFDLPTFSPDSKRLFAVGLQRRGELLRFDSTTHQFVPYLGGISADQLDFSRDREWVAYVSYPEGVLWRARIDGSDALKLTEAPMRVLAPRWSPDGSQIAFVARTDRGAKWQAFVVSANGGLYRRIAPGVDETTGAAWLDKGKKLVLSSPQWDEIRTLDVASGKIAILPGSAHMHGSLISPSGRFLVGSTAEGTSFEILDLKTGERRLLVEDANYPSWSADERSVYFNRFGGSRPAFFRIRLADMKVEKVFDLAAFQATGSSSTWSTVAPDGSFLLLRDLGGADLYAIDWQPE